MKPRTFAYSVGQGFRNIWRNKMFSLASVATMAACIFLFGIFYSIGANFTAMIQEAEEEVSITVFFNEDITQAQIDNIGQLISARPEVSKYDFVSADEAWEEFKESYFEGNEELAESFADDNPLANSSNFEVYLSDVSKQGELVEYIQGLDGVRKVQQSEVTAGTLNDFNHLITYISVAVIIILIAVAVFLISNTITVGIAVRKEEIAIMKLIGAKDSFVRAPFIVEGVTIGLIGSVIPLVLLYYLYSSIISYVAEKFLFLSDMINFIPQAQIFRVLIPVSLLLGVGIGYLGSRFTLKRHLKV